MRDIVPKNLSLFLRFRISVNASRSSLGRGGRFRPGFAGVEGCWRAQQRIQHLADEVLLA